MQGVASNSGNLIGKVAKHLKTSGADLTSDLRIVSQSEAEPLVKVPEPTVSDIALFQSANVSVADVGRALLAKDEGKMFLAEYGMHGLMLPASGPTASAGQIQSREKAVMLGAAAGDAELDEVGSITARKYAMLVDRETRMRVDQMINNYPDEYKGRLLNPKMDRDEQYVKIVAEFSKLDFGEQKRRSRDGGRDVSLPLEDRNKMNALRRGYGMISEMLRERGLTPTHNLSGSLNPNAKVVKTVAENRSLAADFRSRRKGGMERD